MPVGATIVAVEIAIIAYPDGVFLALGIQHAMRMRRSVIMCGQSGCTMFLHIIS
jgi:hypothetical protein